MKPRENVHCLLHGLVAILGATALSFQAFAADTDVGLSFNGDGGNDTQAGTITVNITADTVTLTGTAGAQTVGAQSTQPGRISLVCRR